MKSAVINFPGGNCSQDVYRAMIETGFSCSYVWHKDTSLPSNLDLAVIPGGFSWGDYLRPGALAARAAIIPALRDFAQKGGKVIGICNGFQILCEAGLLPGALTTNVHTEFICSPCYLSANRESSPLLKNLPSQVVNFPIAHRDGNYRISDDECKRLEDEGRIAFYYADAQGTVSPAYNPNGSRNNIAGVVSKQGNTLGLMPHPERAMNRHNKMTDGRFFWQAVLNS